MSEADFVHSSTTPGTNGKAAEKPKGEGALLRGALKLEASTSTPVVSAGTEFSIYVVIRNPFPVPVTIHSTETHIPIELSDEIWRKEERLKTKEVRTKQINDMKPGGDWVRKKDPILVYRSSR